MKRGWDMKKGNDKISVSGVSLRMVIGIEDWERKDKQEILIDYEFECDCSVAIEFALDLIASHDYLHGFWLNCHKIEIQTAAGLHEL